MLSRVQRRMFHAIHRLNATQFQVYIPDNGSNQSFEQHLKFYKQVVYPLQMYTMRNSDIYVSAVQFDGRRHTYTFVVKRPEDIQDYIQRMDQMLEANKSK